MLNPRAYKFFDKKMKIAAFATVVLALFASGCGANESVLKSGKETNAQANVETAKSSFEQDLAGVRAADFLFVYVIRRKDGQKIDAEVRGVIKLQTSDANRRVSADDDRAFIIGSNYQIPPKNMLVLFDRFDVQDFSPPPAVTPNANSNANK